MGLFAPKQRLDAASLRPLMAGLRRFAATAWIFRVRWFRVGVILFCLAFWIGFGFGCQALMRGFGK